MVETSVTFTPEFQRPRRSIGGRNNSPLLRKVLKPQNIQDIVNDDDAERSRLLAEERAQRSSAARSSRSSIDLMKSPQIEHYQGCLKLYTENKINKDNAWNLQLIDFMQSMLKKHDARMENLQTASTVVDASAKIYSFRVDAVHYDVIKMAGGLSKAAQTKRGKRDDEEAPLEDAALDEEAASAAAKKKKKRTKGAIVAKVELLNGDIDANDFIDPFFERLAATAGDVAASNRAFNATLPVNDETLSLMLSTDDPFLEPIGENEDQSIDLSQLITLPTKLLPPFTNSDVICEPFAAFSISNWNPDTEESDHRTSKWVEENRLNLSQQAVAFDVNGEVEPIPLEDVDNDVFDAEPLGCADSDEERPSAVVVRACAGAAGAVARITDMRPSGLRDARLEYSYSSAIVAWSGPEHWRLKNNRASKQPEKTQTTVESKKPTRSRRQLEFTMGGLNFDWRSPPADYEPIHPSKITISQKTLATAFTWHPRNFQMPLDRGLDENHFRHLQLCPNKSVVPLWEKPEPSEPLQLEPQPYDYNNENDASYCPQTVTEEDEWGNEEMGALGEIVPLADADDLGDMVEPPAKVAKVFIPYAMRAKRVDMKQLKHCSWSLMHEKTEDGEEVFKPQTFSTLYSELPNKLSEVQRECLSVPLALLSVLHLANEKGLILENGSDLTDFDIVGRIS